MSAEIRTRLVEAIRSGELAPGSPLPAERQLCDDFGVARTSVREAIQGLLSTGYVVRRGNRPVVSDQLPGIRFDSRLGSGAGLAGGGDDRKAFVRQLFEVRRVIEPKMAEFAALRASEAERAEIVELSARSAKQLAEFREIDRAFHSAIARACGNPMLHEVHAKALVALFGSGELASLLYAEINRREVNEIIVSSTAAHRAIAGAIANGDVVATVAAVQGHLDDVERRTVERLL